MHYLYAFIFSQPGALAAFVVGCSVFPLDTLKTMLQAIDCAQRFPGGRGLCVGLWQGFGPVVVATLPSGASPPTVLVVYGL